MDKTNRAGEVDLEKVNWEKVQAVFAPEKESYFQRIKRGIEKYPLAKDALLILAGAGFVSLAVLMPGLAMVVAKETRQQQRDNFFKRLRRFQKDRLLEIDEGKDGTTVRITREGVKRALTYKLESMKVKRPKHWDGLWRLVIFDVSEKKKRQRDRFRGDLQRLGFYMLNRSVFVHPFPCFDEVEFLREVRDIGQEVTYIVAKSVETSFGLRSHFDLPED